MELQDRKIAEGWVVEFIHEGCSVSRTFIIDRRMRIGGAVIRVGGIGGVGTDEAYRRRGLARRVLERCVEVMTREGYEASFLFGIQDFYHRFGFATAMAEHELVVDAAAARRAEGRLRVRPSRRADTPRLLELYHRQNATRTASCLRAATWRGFTRGTSWSVGAWSRLVVDGGDHICGYVTCDDTHERCKVAEVGGSGDDAHHTLLHLLGRRAARLGVEEIGLSVPPDHPFGLFLRQFGCRINSRYPRNAGPMGRIIHLEPFLERLLPVLAGRWRDPESELVLATDLGTRALRRARRGGELRVVAKPAPGAPRLRLGQAALMQLACGYRTVEDCWLAGQARGTVVARRLAGELFPLQNGHMWWSDRF